MKNLLCSERSKWILVIGVIAIGAGFTAKNVISYPTECMREEIAFSSKRLLNAYSYTKEIKGTPNKYEKQKDLGPDKWI